MSNLHLKWQVTLFLEEEANANSWYWFTEHVLTPDDRFKNIILSFFKNVVISFPTDEIVTNEWGTHLLRFVLLLISIQYCNSLCCQMLHCVAANVQFVYHTALAEALASASPSAWVLHAGLMSEARSHTVARYCNELSNFSWQQKNNCTNLWSCSDMMLSQRKTAKVLTFSVTHFISALEWILLYSCWITFRLPSSSLFY